MIVLAIHQYNIEDTGKTRTSCKFVWNQDVHQVRANNNLSGVFLSWLHVLLMAFQRLSEIGSADCGRTPGLLHPESEHLVPMQPYPTPSTTY
jgi:hypothetical protein